MVNLWKKKDGTGELKKPTAQELFGSKRWKNGALSMGMIAIVICIVVVINLIAGQLPERLRNIDLTDNQLYEISDVSVNMLGELDKKVEIKVLAVKDSTDERIKTFLSKYGTLSKQLDVEWIDPVAHPSALDTYEAESNSIVVECPDTEKSTTISFNDILVVDEMAYYYGNTEPTSFDAEGQLTSAVNYVTSENSKKVYQTTGHGEATFSSSVTDLMDKAGLELNECNLLMESEIPDDCDLLMMYAPTNDLTDDEAAILKDYLNSGGKLYMIMGAAEDALPNLESIMNEYGLVMADGYIADLERCYQGNYYYIFPEISLTDELAEGINSQMVLLVNARGMTQTDTADENITLTSFMSTSSNGHAVTEENDEEGTFLLGAVAEKTVEADESTEAEDDGDAAAEDESGDSEDADESTESEDTVDDSEDNEAAGEGDGTEDAQKSESKVARLTVITAPAMIDAEVTDSFSTLENLTLFMNSVTANFEDVQNIAIEAKSLEITYNTMQHAGVISLAVIFGIPAVVLIGGFVVWWKRRKA